jgi:citrate lyase subunit beta/citryl-CoA lyase
MQLNEARSLLFVPAVSPQHLWTKAAQRGADALIVDLEDSVPLDRKAEARAMACEAIAYLADRAPVLVRVNAPRELLLADVEALPWPRLRGVLLPKVEAAAQVRELAESLAARQPPGATPVPIAALIETPLGVLRAQEIATAHPSVCALGFGGEDYASEMRVPAQPQSLLWAAQAVTNCARAYGLACWGLPGSVAEIQDMPAFAQLVKLARDTGFTGTVCIHPRQVAVANPGFGPTEDERAWAREVLKADETARAKGLGAVTLDGRMIDRPIVERARRWLHA